MSPEERQLLSELFARVGQAASTPRDAEAEAMIRDELARIRAAESIVGRPLPGKVHKAGIKSLRA